MSFAMRWVVKATSVTETEFYDSVIPSNLDVPVLSSLFTICHVKKLALDSTCQTIWVYKQLQNVNFDGLTFLTALVVYSQSDYLNYYSKDSDRLIVECFYESIEHAEDTVIRFGIKMYFKNWK